MFRLLTPDSEVPKACCRREPQTRDGVLLSREECQLGRSPFINKQVPPCSQQGDTPPISTNRAKLGVINVCPEGLKVVGRFLDRVLATVWAPIHASEIQGSGQRIIWTGNELASGWWGGNLGYGSKVSFPNFSEQKLGQGDAP